MRRSVDKSCHQKISLSKATTKNVAIARPVETVLVIPAAHVARVVQAIREVRAVMTAVARAVMTAQIRVDRSVSGSRALVEMARR